MITFGRLLLLVLILAGCKAPAPDPSARMAVEALKESIELGVRNANQPLPLFER